MPHRPASHRSLRDRKVILPHVKSGARAKLHPHSCAEPARREYKALGVPFAATWVAGETRTVDVVERVRLSPTLSTIVAMRP